MALTEQQKTRTLRYLGLSYELIIPTSPYWAQWIWMKLSSPGETIVQNGITIEGGELTEVAEQELIELLNRVEGIDTQLTQATSRLKVTQVGQDIALNTEEIPMLRRERRRVIREIYELLDLRPRWDASRY